MIENSKSYYCDNWQKGCDFSVGKEVRGSAVTEDDIIDICTRGSTFAKDFKSKTGEPIEAFLILIDYDKKKCGKAIAIKPTRRR